MNDVDQASRYAYQNQSPVDYQRWLAPTSAADWEFAGWLNTQLIPFPGEPDRRCDTVTVWRHRDGAAPPVAQVLEFQTDPDPDMPARLAEYALLVRRQIPYNRSPLVRYTVVARVVNLTGPPRPAEWVHGEDAFEARLTVFSPPRTMSAEDAFGTLAGMATGTTPAVLLPWVPLMAGAERPDVVAAWVERVDGVPDPKERATHAALALVFAGAVDRVGAWKPFLEKYMHVKSPVVEAWRAEGEAKGRRETALRLVLQLGEPRLGACPADVRGALEQIPALDRLERLVVAATTADSWDAVLATP